MKTIGAWIARFSVVGIIAALALSAMVRLVSANLLNAEPDDMPSEAPPSAAALDEISLLLGQIAQREAELERKEAALQNRAAELEEAELMIQQSIDDLVAAQAALEARMFASDNASEADLANLTLIYEGMKPKDAAALFETMDPDFAAGFLARMNPDAAAAVFSNLSPLTAYAVSATIAGRNTSAATEQEE